MSKLTYLKKYGLTENEYDYLRHKSLGLCQICFEKKKLVIDHDHNTGSVRALLCAQCNSAIGLFKENPVYLCNAVEYLLRNKSKSDGTFKIRR
jgi:hypothetical protein